jgi:hypothetical protein
VSKHEKGSKPAKPVLVGLKEYRGAEGAPPVLLKELVPDHLTSSERAACEDALMDTTYRRTADGYTLCFRYYGPGVNDCCFESGSGVWTCNGYF